MTADAPTLPDLVAVCARLEKDAERTKHGSPRMGWWCVVQQDDVLALLSALRARDEALRVAGEALEAACEEIADLRCYANNHGAMYDEEEFTAGQNALSTIRNLTEQETRREG